ncbi:MAG: glycoside hydrolase family 13 protein [Defluviitaleaceae bacterium]|nr:glycoside hydrolase family 13 protein [Defluviitaleaceae bacterium]
MYIHHRSLLPYCYYDTAEKKIRLKLITDASVTAVKVLYGDPFIYAKTDKINALGNDVWEWVTNETPMQPQYADKKNITWRVAITPPKARRTKYYFVITNKNGEEIAYSENGVGDTESHFFFPFAHDIDAPKTPEWASETIWYQIFPERFHNGDPSISPAVIEDWETGLPKPRNFFGGDLRGVIDKLPYLRDLGVTGIYFTPVFHSPSNHKYDTQDYYAVDPHFGDTQTLKELVKKAHASGMKVMLDAVFNHIGARHPFWQDVLKNQKKSKYRDYFHIRSFPVREKYESAYALNYDAFAFVPGMPKWNTENPEARQYLIDVALYWIKECDIDGWRLDVSDEVSFSFWRALREAVDAAKPDFYLLGEVWHDPSKWLHGGYFDAVMNYPLGNLLRDLFFTQKITPDTFTQKLFAKLSGFSDIHSRVQFNLMDSHDTVRVLTKANGDKQAMKNALTFLFLMKGAPSIYYGTEVGMEGNGDPGSRGPMVWDEAKQDKDLTVFFKDMISLRKRYNTLIQNADIAYSRKGNRCSWKLSNGPDTLEIIYNIKNKKEVFLCRKH